MAYKTACTTVQAVMLIVAIASYLVGLQSLHADDKKLSCGRSASLCDCYLHCVVAPVNRRSRDETL